VLEGFEEEKCKIQEEIFNRKMGQLQINDCVNVLGALDSKNFNDESSYGEEIIEYEGKIEDDP